MKTEKEVRARIAELREENPWVDAFTIDDISIVRRVLANCQLVAMQTLYWVLSEIVEVSERTGE